MSRPECIQSRNVGRMVIKPFITIQMRNLLSYRVVKMKLVRVPHSNLWPQKSFMQQDKVFINLIWWNQMTDIQNEDDRHKHAHNHTHAEQTKELHCTIFLLEIMTFSDLRVGSCFLENFITSSMFHPECIQWQHVTRVVLKLFITIKIKILL